MCRWRYVLIREIAVEGAEFQTNGTQWDYSSHVITRAIAQMYFFTQLFIGNQALESRVLGHSFPPPLNLAMKNTTCALRTDTDSNES